VVVSTATQPACDVGGGEGGVAPAIPANAGTEPNVPSAMAPAAISRLFIESAFRWLFGPIKKSDTLESASQAPTVSVSIASWPVDRRAGDRLPSTP
jgi:hypothetical protein